MNIPPGRMFFRGLIALALLGPLLAWLLATAYPDETPTPYVLAMPTGPVAAALSVSFAEHFPIPLGAMGPAGSPAQAEQYPFLCEAQRSGLGQPEVDNQDGHGVAVYREDADGQPTAQLAGYSRDCGVKTRVDHYYKPVGRDDFVRWDPGAADVLADVDVVLVGGRAVPFIVRVERGTINRFLYAIAVLSDPAEDTEAPDGRYWNRRLVYLFGGGVGIGRRQGRLSMRGLLDHHLELLAAGYALVTSTGNHTTNHYNMVLAGDTALRVKRQFVARYDAPLFTIGLGGSGGGLQQYLFAQNLPGLIDGAVAQYSYPDMVTQTIHVLDCELLEYYFDVAAADPARWRDHDRRRQVAGLNAINGADNRYGLMYPANYLVQGRWPRMPAGSSECAQSWRGLTPLVLNPRHTPHARHYAPEVVNAVNWTYWDDLVAIYGRDASGHARRTWDNVGVQYGLQALREGALPVHEFLDLNARIGGWKPAADMAAEYLWQPFNLKAPFWFSLWSAHNRLDAGRAGPAPRSRGDPEAIAAAYRSGQVFMGYLDIPVIDVRHDREAELDMHHISASFATRARIERAMGDADRQAIWVADIGYDPTPRALYVMDQWLSALRASPRLGVLGNRPPAARDSCFDAHGALIASGDGVWHGAWNGRATGACTHAMRSFATSRIAAGGPITGDVFRCHLQSVAAAFKAGVYLPVDMRPHLEALARTFPDGVCDYSQGDAGRPADAVPARWQQAAAPPGPVQASRKVNTTAAHSSPISSPAIRARRAASSLRAASITCITSSRSAAVSSASNTPVSSISGCSLPDSYSDQISLP